MTGPTWMETGTEQAFLRDGWAPAGAPDFWKRFDVEETTIRVVLKNGLKAAINYPDRGFGSRPALDRSELREALGKIGDHFARAEAEAFSCAREDRDW